ncbi:ankyrin repeat-containing domain protein [Xylariaceae sp. FL0255]|nr:ankyrin repeat-containing domain protein [Xylariaceae sp. FL0255]
MAETHKTGQATLGNVPAEIFENILSFVIPEDWNAPGMSREKVKECLDLRFVSKCFFDFVSYQALRKLHHGHLLKESSTRNESSIKWLFKTKFRAGRGDQKGLAADIWNAISSIELFHSCNFKLTQEDENSGKECRHEALFNSAYDGLVSCKGYDWVLEQLKVPAENTDMPPIRTVDPAHLREKAIEAMMRYPSLQIAAYHGDHPVVEVLMKNDVNPNDRYEIYGHALWAAAYKGHIGIARLLIDNGADVECQGYLRHRVIRLEDPTSRSGSVLARPLEAATFQGHTEMLEQLLNRGKASVPRNCLLYAPLDRSEEAAELLMERDETDVNVNDSRGWPILFEWIMCYNTRRVQLLLDRQDLNPSPELPDGKMPIYWSVKHGFTRIVQAFMSRQDIDLNQTYGDKRTLLTTAIRCRNPEGPERTHIVGLLLSQESIDPNLPDDLGEVPLIAAIRQGKEKTVKILLARKDICP